MYYVFRQTGDKTYECSKWEDGGSQPLDVYEITWRKGTLSAHMCSCPARIPCRHLKMMQQVLDSGEKLWEVIYEEDIGITKVVDQTVCVFRELMEV